MATTRLNKLKIRERNLKDLIFAGLFQVNFDLFFHFAKFVVEKIVWAVSMRERNVLKLCLTKQLLHMFKLWCGWGINKECELEFFL